MQANALSTIGLPLALAIIMLGLGLHLRTADFRRILVQPKAILVGLLCQSALLPVICFFLCKAMGLSAELAVGMMLLAASPGGITANLYSHLFKGDVALNISLTAINSVLSIISIPVIVNLALESFMGSQAYIPLQFRKTLEVIVMVLAPVGIGMVLNARFPRLSQRMDKPVKIASALILAILILVIVIREWAVLAANYRTVGLACLVFNLLSMFTGYWAGKIARLGEAQNRAIAFEIGLHNGTLAIYLALAVLNNGAMSIAPAMYGLLMFFTAAAFGWYVTRRQAS